METSSFRSGGMSKAREAFRDCTHAKRGGKMALTAACCTGVLVTECLFTSFLSFFP